MATNLLEVDIQLAAASDSAEHLLRSIGLEHDAAAVRSRTAAARHAGSFVASSLRHRANGLRSNESLFLQKTERSHRETAAALHGLPDVAPPAAIDAADVWDRLSRLGNTLAALDDRNDLVAAHHREALLAMRAELIADFGVGEWQAVAYQAAGIDPTRWVADLGLYANDRWVRGVYDFYTSLFQADDRLQWAGLGAMVGQQFYAAWQDIYVLRHVADDGQRMKYLLELSGAPALPDVLWDVMDVAISPFPGTALVEHVTSEELEWLEVRMLDMQRQIFDDLAWQHLAFRIGGIDALETAFGESALDLRTLDWWRMIETGQSLSVLAGTIGLLWREQSVIIQDDYDAIRGRHGPIGDALALLLTWLADSPIPGSHPYREVFSRTRHVPIAAGRLFPFVPNSIPIQEPVGDVTAFEDRWAWILDDIVPAYSAVLDDPVAVEAWLEEPVVVRARAERMLWFLPYPADRR